MCKQQSSFKELSIGFICFIFFLLFLSLHAIAQQQPPQQRGRGTVYEFEAEDVLGRGKGPSNVFLKVGELKNPKLLEMRKHFRPEMRRSLNLLQ